MLSNGKPSLWNKVRLLVWYRYFKLKELSANFDDLVKYADYKFYEQHIVSMYAEIEQGKVAH